jgi:predicted flap endonuclease-1-like 5' DNA nuclease
MADVTEIEGIGPAYAEKLKLAGITTTAALLSQGASPRGRQDVAKKTGISDTLILRWVNHADLFRVKGVGAEYAELLEAAGVDSVPELAQRNPANLYQALVQANQEKKLVRRPPVESQVKDWVDQAKRLPRVVTY